MTIKRLIVGKVPIRRLRIGLLVSGLTSLLVFAGMGPANAAAPLTAVGNGMTLTVVSVQLVNKVAVNANFRVTCTTANDPDDPSDSYSVIAGFTLSENVKGTIVSYQLTNGPSGNWPVVTCDGTPHTFTIQLVPSGPSAYKAGSAYVSNGQAGAYDSDQSCGTNPNFGNFPNPCNDVSFSGGVQITG
jgi:hypothetical protein